MKRHSLLVIDDEPIIADDLAAFFKEDNRLDLVVDKAYSGIEAIEILESKRVDILLLDITMPGMTGLELQRVISKKWPKCKVIFLTGYNSFDFAQEAIHNEGFDYILKSEGDEKIVETVQRALLQIAKDEESEELLQRTKKIHDRSIQILRNEFLTRLINRKSSDDIDKNRLSELGIPLDPDKPLVLLVGRLDQVPEADTSKDKMLMKIAKIVEKHLSMSLSLISTVQAPYLITWYIQQKKPSEMYNYSTFVVGMLKSIQDCCTKAHQLSVSFAINHKPFTWEEIPDRFDVLCTMLNRAPGPSKILLVREDTLAWPDSDIAESTDNLVNDLGKIGLLYTYLERGDQLSFCSLYSSIKERSLKTNKTYYYLLKEVCFSLAAMVLSFINRRDLHQEICRSISLNRLTAFNHDLHEGDFFNYFDGLIDVLFQYLGKEKAISPNAAVLAVQRYIHNHLGGDLSLTRLADIARMNPSYLSRLFRQITFQNLSSYISECRLAKASEMLLEGRYSVKEVASAVGFWTASAFTKFFRRHKNLTPSEFKSTTRYSR